MDFTETRPESKRGGGDGNSMVKEIKREIKSGKEKIY